jgi:hypothetical protein
MAVGGAPRLRKRSVNGSPATQSDEPEAAAAKPPASSNGFGHDAERDEVHRERHDSVMHEPVTAVPTAHQDVKPSSNDIRDGHSSNVAPEIKQLRDKVSQLESENADLQKKQQVMQREIEASMEHVRKAVLEFKHEQLEQGKRVERLYQAEEKRQLKGSAQAPFHLIIKTSESLLSLAS